MKERKITQFINELIEIGYDDCWTEDDTYDYALEIVEETLKTFKLKHVDVEEHLNQLISAIHRDITDIIQFFDEHMGDKWRPNENPHLGKIKKQTENKLRKSIKKWILKSTKYINELLLYLQKIERLNIRDEKTFHKIMKLNDVIYNRRKKPKTISVNTRLLESVLNEFFKVLDNQNKPEIPIEELKKVNKRFKL